MDIERAINAIYNELRKIATTTPVTDRPDHEQICSCLYAELRAQFDIVCRNYAYPSVTTDQTSPVCPIWAVNPGQPPVWLEVELCCSVTGWTHVEVSQFASWLMKWGKAPTDVDRYFVLIAFFDYDPLDPATRDHGRIVRELLHFEESQRVYRKTFPFEWGKESEIAFFGAWVWKWHSNSSVVRANLPTPTSHGLDGSRILQLFDEARTAAWADIKESNGRGLLCPALGLSCKRLQAFSKGTYFEEVLERTIVDVMHEHDNSLGWWYNQFNVAGGLANQGDRRATDIVHISRRGETATELHFIELKEWKSSDSPEEAATELLIQFFLFWHLARRGVDPYDNKLWSYLLQLPISLWLMVPECYATRHNVSVVLPQISETFQRVKARCDKLQNVTFRASALLLNNQITRASFSSQFDRQKVEEFIKSHRWADQPRDVLENNAFTRLRQWVVDSCRRAGLKVDGTV